MLIRTSIQGTQKRVESIFISIFTMNNIAPKLQKCWTRKIAIKNAKAIKFLLQSAFYTSKRSTCKVLPFYDFRFKFYDTFCGPYPIIDLLRMFNHQNWKLNCNLNENKLSLNVLKNMTLSMIQCLQVLIMVKNFNQECQST